MWSSTEVRILTTLNHTIFKLPIYTLESRPLLSPTFHSTEHFLTIQFRNGSRPTNPYIKPTAEFFVQQPTNSFTFASTQSTSRTSNSQDPAQYQVVQLSELV